METKRGNEEQMDRMMNRETVNSHPVCNCDVKQSIYFLTAPLKVWKGVLFEGNIYEVNKQNIDAAAVKNLDTSKQFSTNVK